MAARVVVVGGGFAGVRVAAGLAKVAGDRAAVTLVDRQNYFLFTPMLPEVVSGEIETRHIVTPLRALCPEAEFHQASLAGIDESARTVTVSYPFVERRAELAYDHLVITAGGVTDSLGIDGVTTHALTLKSLGDALLLRNLTIQKLERAAVEPDIAVRRALCTFVVGGAGYSGTELAGTLVDFLARASRFYRGLAKETRVVLVDVAERVLPAMHPELSRFAESELVRKGVEMRLGRGVSKATESAVALTDGEVIDTHSFIWTAGVAPTPAAEIVPGEHDKRGRLVTDDCLRVIGAENLWAAGDIAAIPDLKSGGTCPPTAQFADRQGKYLARAIASEIGHRQPKPFKHKSRGMLVSLGRRDAVDAFGPLRIRGFPAWWLWRTVYLAKLPSLQRRARVLLDWTVDLAFPPDIAQLPISRAASTR